MKKTIFCLYFLASILIGGEIEKKKEAPLSFLSHPSYQQLAFQYKQWLNLVAYIATAEEKSVFLKLPSDHDRDLFISIFWKQRDPTPGTEINEFQEECAKRFATADSQFSRGTPRPGWMTDMGRIYMILGKPESTESFDNLSGLYPAQVWYYHGDAALGLPTYFNIAFFKKLGLGEWVIYDPVSDGPSSLLVNSEEYGSQDYRQLYERIRKLAPTLAAPSISMIPGQIPYGYSPQPQNNLIMANIYQSPIKRINISYASSFLNYKGYVSVESSTRFIEQSHGVYLLAEPRYECHFLHIAVKPKKISVNFFEDKNQYYLQFRMIVSLKRGETVVFQNTRNYDYYLSKEELEILQAGGLILEDAFPIVPGPHQLAVFIENSISKEFSYFETSVNCPDSSASLYLLPPLLGTKLQTAANNFFAPFQAAGQRLSIDPDLMFSLNDPVFIIVPLENIDENLQKSGKLEWEVEATSGNASYHRNGIIPLPSEPRGPNFFISTELPLPERRPGYYRLTLRLVNAGGTLLAVQNADFSISQAPRLPRPTEISQQVPIDNPFRFQFMLGMQYFHLDDLPAAESLFYKSLQAKPDFPDSEKMLLETLLRQKKFAAVLREADIRKTTASWQFDYHRIRGIAEYGLGKYSGALTELLTAQKIISNDFQLINMIGRTFLALNNPSEAATAFEASLQINPDQSEIRTILSDLQAQTPKKNKEESNK